MLHDVKLYLRQEAMGMAVCSPEKCTIFFYQYYISSPTLHVLNKF